MLNKFSEELKEARINKELSLQQIAARTRIDLKFLENLENGNFAFLPELYIKAFIREYAKLVGLDEKITLKKFDAAKRSKAYDELGNTEDDTKKLKLEEVKQSKPQSDTPSYTPTFEAFDSSNQQTETSSELAKKKKLLIGIAIGIVIIFAIVYFAFIKESSDIIVSEKPYDQVQKDNEERFTTETQKPAVADSIFVVKSDSLSLVLKSNDASWIKILIDGTKTEEFTLFPNSYKEVKALNNYRMTIGNAGAIQIKLNNRPLNFFGNKNEVKYVSIDSTGLQYLTSSPNP
ncbi:MAG: helix-turn-helix domain-containing protein [Ignavibacteriaceae bacterium]|jgi:transcriptional regulator with XRE-family HTH domain